MSLSGTHRSNELTFQEEPVLEVTQVLKGMSANDLACQAQDGCADAFMELVNRFRPRLLRFVEKRQGGNWAEAEDVVQDAFTQAWNRLDQFNPRYQFTTWLYTIAANRSIDSHRRQTRQVSFQAQTDPPDQPRDPSQPSEDRLIEQEDRTNLWAIARQVLNSTQYSAMWLRYAEELSVKEVATILKKTSVGVRVILHRSRSILQPHLISFLDDSSRQRFHSNESGDTP